MNADAPRHPPADTSTADATLISSIDSATARTDSLGTSALDIAREAETPRPDEGTKFVPSSTTSDEGTKFVLSSTNPATFSPDGPTPPTPIEEYPSEPIAAFSPDGPTLFDEAGNPEPDPTEVLVGPVYVPFVPLRRPGEMTDAEAGHTVKSPQRKRRTR